MKKIEKIKLIDAMDLNFDAGVIDEVFIVDRINQLIDKVNELEAKTLSGKDKE